MRILRKLKKTPQKAGRNGAFGAFFEVSNDPLQSCKTTQRGKSIENREIEIRIRWPIFLKFNVFL